MFHTTQKVTTLLLINNVSPNQHQPLCTGYDLFHDCHHDISQEIILYWGPGDVHSNVH